MISATLGVNFIILSAIVKNLHALILKQLKLKKNSMIEQWKALTITQNIVSKNQKSLQTILLKNKVFAKNNVLKICQVKNST